MVYIIIFIIITMITFTFLLLLFVCYSIHCTAKKEFYFYRETCFPHCE